MKAVFRSTFSDKDPFKIYRSRFKKLITEQEKFVEELASKFLEDLKRAIYRQTLPLEPLSDDYLKHKQEHGFDERILIKTGAYIKSFKIRFRRYLGQYIATVYIEEDYNSLYINDITNKMLYKILEYGTSQSPARPHWRPIRRLFVKNLPKYQKTVQNRMKRSLNK